MQLKATHHVALMTRNFAKLEKFYTETLGLPVTRRWDDVGDWRLETGDWRLETGDWRLETGRST